MSSLYIFHAVLLTNGKGATFSFSLPLIIQQDHRQYSMTIHTTTTTTINDIEERIKKKRDDKGSSYYNSHKTKMNDDYDHTITFKLGLELAGFEVDAYNDSAMALSNFKADYYDLLLIDINIPKIDGFELYEKMKKMDDKVKVWFITAYEIYCKTLKEVLAMYSGCVCEVPF